MTVHDAIEYLRWFDPAEPCAMHCWTKEEVVAEACNASVELSDEEIGIILKRLHESEDNELLQYIMGEVVGERHNIDTPPC